jgi:hypothetical protein
MEHINVTLSLESDQIDKLTEAVNSKIMENFDIDEIAEKINLDEAIETFLENQYDLDDKISDRVTDYIEYNVDFEDIAKDTIRGMDMSEYIEEIDVEDKLQQLMRGYSPINGCPTGNLATETVKKAVRYLLLKDEDFVADITNALEKSKAKREIEAAKAEIIAEAKPMMYEEFKKELEEYFKTVDAHNVMTTNVITSNPNPNPVIQPSIWQTPGQ